MGCLGKTLETAMWMRNRFTAACAHPSLLPNPPNNGSLKIEMLPGRHFPLELGAVKGKVHSVQPSQYAKGSFHAYPKPATSGSPCIHVDRVARRDRNYCHSGSYVAAG